MSVTKIGVRVPHDYDLDAAADRSALIVESPDGEASGTYSPAVDGVGYIIEVWVNSIGLVTFWRADTAEEAARWLDDTIAKGTNS